MLAEYICYDDGCHLKKYAENLCRRDQTATTKILSELHIVVDKMHMAGHVDKWSSYFVTLTSSLTWPRYVYRIPKINLALVSYTGGHRGV